MALKLLGAGSVTFTRTDTAIPIALNATVQEVMINETAKTVALRGSNAYPYTIVTSERETKMKVKKVFVSGLAWNNLFFGNSFTAGRDVYYTNEAHTPSGTTQAVTNATGGIVDLGVNYAATGLPLQRVAAGSEAQGKYSVNQSTGTYTFAIADEVALLFNYSNFSATASGQQLNVVNLQMGTNPTFQFDYWVQTQGQVFAARHFCCVASSLAIAGKNSDYIIPELDFECCANAAGQIKNYDFGEIS
jgi:hypothetical protein